MAPTVDPIESILAAAVEIASEPDRRQFVDQACAGDSDLKRRVEVMVENYFQAGSFLEVPPLEMRSTADLPIRERPGTMIGPYKLLEQIGEGGFGVVFMAEQTHPVRRKVAVKVIKPGMDSRQVVARFEAERQALALMDHPNIAKVLDADATDLGRPYFVMELVRGIPVTQFCDDKRLTARERLALFLSVCQAIQHAHQKGIIHRDLKPSNVLVTLHDGVPVPKVIDFGVAKALGQQLTEKTLFTGFAQMVGTPLYMSPEQAELSGLDADTRTDIYSLGVLLYELLTGTTPLDKDRLSRVGYDELRRIIREVDPPRPSTRISTLGADAVTVCACRGSEPRKLSALVRGELDWVVMKCLDKDRNRRYESVSGLVADLQRYLHDEPVLACPPSAVYRFRKLARRNRRTLAMVSVLAVAAFVGVGALAVSTALVWRADQEVRKANEELKAAVDHERREVYLQRITGAYRELSANNVGQAWKLLGDCPEELRGWEWHYLIRLCRVDPLVIWDKAEVNGVAFSRDGEQLVSAGGDGTVKIWNSRTGEPIRIIPKAHTDSVVSVAFHPDGKHVASRGADLWVKVWDLTAPDHPVWKEQCDAVRKFGTAYTIAFSTDGRLLATGTDGVVKAWDWEQRQLLYELPGHNFHAIPVTFSGDGRLATGSFRQGLKFWNAETGAWLRTIDTVREPVSALAFSPDNQWLASVSLRGPVTVSNSTTGELRCRFDNLHSGNVECVAFSSSGRLLASGGEDKTVRVWNATTGRELLGLQGHTDRCACVAFSSDGLRLVSASSDKTIRIWDGTPLREDEVRQETFTFTEHGDEIRSVAFSPKDSQWIASAGGDGLVKVWDVRTGQVSTNFNQHRDFTGHSVVVFGVARHPKRPLIASTGVDAVRVWDAGTGGRAFELTAVPGQLALPFHAVAFSSDGRYLVTGKVDGAVQIWDADTHELVGLLGSHKREIRGLVFSHDGEHLASASSDGELKLWDAKRLDKKSLAEKQEARRTIPARVAGPGLSVAFSPDGRRLVTAGERNTIKIWDVQTGTEAMKPLEGHGGEVYAIASGSDDKDGWIIASGGEDSTVKIWDGRTGKLLHTFRGHTGLVSSVAFSPDGQWLVSGSRDHTVKVWDLKQVVSGER